MNESFDIPVIYKGEEILFKGELLAYGYSYKIQVDVNGSIVLFEPDEEKKYRAVIPYGEIGNNKNVDAGLLKNIAAKLEELLS